MARHHLTPEPARAEEALTVLFCTVDDAYRRLNPKGRRYESLKRLSDSEVLTLALFQQLRGVESCRAFLRDAGRFLPACSRAGRALALLADRGCSGCGVPGTPAAPNPAEWSATPRRDLDSTLLAVLPPGR